MIQATSAPLVNVHDSPHSICVATSGPKSVTRPVAIIAVPMRTWETTSDHFRLIVSATTPAGISSVSAITP